MYRRGSRRGLSLSAPAPAAFFGGPRHWSRKRWYPPRLRTGMRLLDLCGKQFGLLTVVARADSKGRDRRWRCRCACGGHCEVATAVLNSGKKSHCGCASPPRAASIRHGYYGTRLYRIWSDMKASCRRPSHYLYSSRGARGVAYAAQWQEFVQFRSWAMRSGYAHDKALRRHDRQGDFTPENCWWGPCLPRGAKSSRSKW